MLTLDAFLTAPRSVRGVFGSLVGLVALVVEVGLAGLMNLFGEFPKRKMGSESECLMPGTPSWLSLLPPFFALEESFALHAEGKKI